VSIVFGYDEADDKVMLIAKSEDLASYGLITCFLCNFQKLINEIQS
jgi:hypothetical protein